MQRQLTENSPQKQRRKQEERHGDSANMAREAAATTMQREKEAGQIEPDAAEEAAEERHERESEYDMQDEQDVGQEEHERARRRPSAESGTDADSDNGAQDEPEPSAGPAGPAATPPGAEVASAISEGRPRDGSTVKRRRKVRAESAGVEDLPAASDRGDATASPDTTTPRRRGPRAIAAPQILPEVAIPDDLCFEDGPHAGESFADVLAQDRAYAIRALTERVADPFGRFADFQLWAAAQLSGPLGKRLVRFGKYSGMTFDEVLTRDPTYCSMSISMHAVHPDEADLFYAWVCRRLRRQQPSVRMARPVNATDIILRMRHLDDFRVLLPHRMATVRCTGARPERSLALRPQHYGRFLVYLLRHMVSIEANGVAFDARAHAVCNLAEYAPPDDDARAVHARLSQAYEAYARPSVPSMDMLPAIYDCSLCYAVFFEGYSARVRAAVMRPTPDAAVWLPPGVRGVVEWAAEQMYGRAVGVEPPLGITAASIRAEADFIVARTELVSVIVDPVFALATPVKFARLALCAALHADRALAAGAPTITTLTLINLGTATTHVMDISAWDPRPLLDYVGAHLS